YVNVENNLKLTEFHYVQKNGYIKAFVSGEWNGEEFEVIGKGNGRLDSVVDALAKVTHHQYVLETYTEHALEVSSKSQAASYVGLKEENGKVTWGVGIDSDIIVSSVKALVSAINRMV
ncbi:MAG: 2-isopropylmalate synthase, partial [Clostridia bacterium]|nr:2-isopropylmalate synthase [Clostridia bacterium]